MSEDFLTGQTIVGERHKIKMLVLGEDRPNSWLLSEAEYVARELDHLTEDGSELVSVTALNEPLTDLLVVLRNPVIKKG